MKSVSERSSASHLAAACRLGLRYLLRLRKTSNVKRLLEAWLVTPDGRPAPKNETFLARVGLPEVTPELAHFNIELNANPQPLARRG